MERALVLAGEAVVPTGDPDMAGCLLDLLDARWVGADALDGRVFAAAGAGADPVRPILDAFLRARPLHVRFGIGIAGETASARACAAAALDGARPARRAIGVHVALGDPDLARELDDRAAVLEALCAGITPRQAEIARHLLLGGRRQAEVAAELGVSRATISVAVARSRVPAIAAAHRLLTSALAAGSARGVSVAVLEDSDPDRRFASQLPVAPPNPRALVAQ